MVFEFNIRTFEKEEFIHITPYIERALEASGVENGLCVVYVPHTTAGVTINENADPSVCEDIIQELAVIVPDNDGYTHAEGNSAAHIKSSMMGVSQTLVVFQGRLLLGRWQGIFFTEFDGPRTRTVQVKIMADTGTAAMTLEAEEADRTL